MTGQAAGSSRTTGVNASKIAKAEGGPGPVGVPAPDGRITLNKSQRQKLREKYGLHPDEYLQLHAEQGGVCGICRMPDAGFNSDGSPRRLAVDHDHATGAIRGLLCVNCNLILAHAKDRIDLLLTAADYLASPPRLLSDRERPRRANNNATKTHCKHGHEFTSENTYRKRQSWGIERVCRTCRRARRRAAA